MAATEVGLIPSSLSTHFFHNYSNRYSQTRRRLTSSAMWNNNKKQMCQVVHEDNDVDDDSNWEVRAFEEDTRGNVLGCTWPPRSYTCTFCRREFRSAQALGGHMNVHRRDRARQHQLTPQPFATAVKPAALLIHPITTPQQNGLCLLYALPNPNTATLIPNPPLDLPSSSLLPVIDTAANSVVSSTNTEPSVSNSNDNNPMNFGKDSSAIEELDLELRLGRKPPPSL